MDWDDILATVAGQLGVRLDASPLEIVRGHAGPPHAAVLDEADVVLRRLAAPGRALVVASKGLARYQIPVLRALGLEGFFHDILTPESTGALKRDAAFFAPWLARARLAVMVGDHYEDDVVAPYRFGLRTVWKLNTAEDALRGVGPLARPHVHRYAQGQTVRPDAIILSLHELPEVIDRLDAYD